MTSRDDLTQLKQMYQRGEISDEQYDALRRHVLWGTPPPQLLEEPAAPPPAPPRPPPPPPAARTVHRSRHPAAPPRPPASPVPDQADDTADRRAGRRSTVADADRARPTQRGPGRRAPADSRLTGPATGPAPFSREPPQRRRPRKRRGPRLLAGLTSLVLALALAAAGVWWFALREIGVDAPAYARSVCSSVRDWQQAVDSGSSVLVRSIAQQHDRRAVRTSVAAHYTDLAGRTDALRGAVMAAGVVDVPGGQAYADSLAAAVGDQSAALRDLAARAGRLDVGSEPLFQISLQSLLTGAETAVSDVTAALARPEAGTPAQLRLALSDEPACAPYVG